MNITILIKKYLCAAYRFINSIENTMSISQPYPSQDESYKHLIVITGFGHSGSGTLIDFFSEFDNTTVFGGHDPGCGGPLSHNQHHSTEIDFLRHGGGVFYLENIIESSNIFIKDFSIKQFITLSEYCYRQGSPYTDKYMELTNAFIDSLLDFKLISPNGGREYCPEFSFMGYTYFDYKNLLSPLIFNPFKESYIYHLKNMSKEEYIQIASKYVRTFLSTIQSRPYLVLDQFVSDGNPDIDYHTKYCGPFKQLCVFRDPRDVFVTGVIKNEYWIPKNPEDFIIWYRANVSDYLTYSHPNLLILRFEDFVLDYDNVSEKIMNFVGINKSHHIHPKEWFDPSISCKNIGLWKYFEDQQAIRSIEHELGEYCYHST